MNGLVFEAVKRRVMNVHTSKICTKMTIVTVNIHHVQSGYGVIDITLKKRASGLNFLEGVLTKANYQRPAATVKRKRYATVINYKAEKTKL